MVIMAGLGLLGLVTGMALVNLVSTPRGAQIGTVVAGGGVILLALVAIFVVVF